MTVQQVQIQIIQCSQHNSIFSSIMQLLEVKVSEKVLVRETVQ